MVSFCWRALGKAGEQPRFDGERLHAGENGGVVLPRQDRGRAPARATCLAAHDALERGAQRHLRFAHAHVAAQQAVHRVGLFHVFFYFGRAGELVGRFVVFKTRFKIPLPLVVLGERIALGLLAPGIQSDQLFCHLLRGLAHAAFWFCSTRRRPASRA